MAPLANAVLTALGRDVTGKTILRCILHLIWPEWRQRASLGRVARVIWRGSAEVALWRQAVLNRDGHACVVCGTGKKLTVHHILGWSAYPEQRLTVGNGVTLCHPCHDAEHRRLNIEADRDYKLRLREARIYCRIRGERMVYV